MNRWSFPYRAARPQTIAAGAGLLWIGLAGCATPDPASWMAARAGQTAAFNSPGCTSCQAGVGGAADHDMNYFAHLAPGPHSPQASPLRASQPHRFVEERVAVEGVAAAPLGPDAADLEQVDAHQQAVDCMKEGRFAEANQWFVEALAQKPHDPNLLSDVGYAQILVKDFEGAEETLRGSLEIAPGNRTAQVNLALAMAAQGRIAESLLLFQRHEGKSQALASAGEAAILGGRVDAARECFEEALRINPKNEIAALGIDQLPPPTYFSASPDVAATPAKVEMAPLPRPKFGPPPVETLPLAAPQSEEPVRIEAKQPAGKPMKSASHVETNGRTSAHKEKAAPLHEGPGFGPAPLPELSGDAPQLVPLEPPARPASPLPEPTARHASPHDFAPLALAAAEAEAEVIPLSAPEPSAKRLPPTPVAAKVEAVALKKVEKLPETAAKKPEAAPLKKVEAPAAEKKETNLAAAEAGSAVRAATPGDSASATAAKGGHAFPAVDAAATATAPAMRAAVAKAKTTWTAAKKRSQSTAKAEPAVSAAIQPTGFESTPTTSVPAASSAPASTVPTAEGISNSNSGGTAGAWRPRRSVHPDLPRAADAKAPTVVGGTLPHPGK